jgi:CspA family cold shock protein
LPRNAWQIATVREWREDEGWGVVTTDDVPEGVWLHITDVEADGFPFLKPGDRLEVKVEGPLLRPGRLSTPGNGCAAVGFVKYGTTVFAHSQSTDSLPLDLLFVPIPVLS